MAKRPHRMYSRLLYVCLCVCVWGIENFSHIPGNAVYYWETDTTCNLQRNQIFFRSEYILTTYMAHIFFFSVFVYASASLCLSLSLSGPHSGSHSGPHSGPHSASLFLCGSDIKRKRDEAHRIAMPDMPGTFELSIFCAEISQLIAYQNKYMWWHRHRMPHILIISC